MPRGQQRDLLSSLRAQASSVIGQVESHIRRLEGELEDLREQADVWRKAVGGKLSSSLGLKGLATRRGRSAGATRPRGSNRVNWDDVLASVPQRFGVEDVMKHPGAAAKGRAQAYPALNRWEATKRIKRVSKGVYEKATGSPATASASPAKHGATKKRSAAKRPTTGKKRGRPANSKWTEAK